LGVAKIAGHKRLETHPALQWSEEGKGSSFTIVLPLVLAKPTFDS
jgi:hypothetical protein